MTHDLHYTLVIVENCNFVPCIAEERICPARMVEVMDDSCDEQCCQLNGLQLVLGISAHHIKVSVNGMISVTSHRVSLTLDLDH